MKTFLFFLLIASQLDAATLNVGATRTLKTFQAAVSVVQDGDTIALDNEKFILPTSLAVKKVCSIIGPATISWVNADNVKPQRDYTAVSIGNKVTLNKLKFEVYHCWALTLNKWAKGTVIKDCVFTMKSAASGVQILNAEDITIEDSEFDCSADYSVYCGFNTNKNITIRRSKFLGGLHHIIRTHMTHGLVIEDCYLDNTWNKYGSYHGGALNLRDGRDFTVRNCTVYGSIGFGPLPQAAPTVRLEGAKLINTVQHGAYLALEAGTSGVYVDGFTIYADQSGNAINVKSKPNTPDASGTIRNTKAYYKGGVLCKNKVPSLTWENVVFASTTQPSISEYYAKPEVDEYFRTHSEQSPPIFKVHQCPPQ